MTENDEYYGILLNKDIPKLDKKNRYTKKVNICFEGQAFLRKKDDDEKNNIEIENDYEITKEGQYIITFMNNDNEVYKIEVEIKMSYLLIILLLFIFGFIIAFILCKLNFVSDNKLSDLTDYINLSIIGLKSNNNEDVVVETMDIEQTTKVAKNTKTKVIETAQLTESDETETELSETEDEYNFDVIFEGISSDNISLWNSVSAQTLAKNKIAPGVKGSFSIVMSTIKSTVDMKYKIEFRDITNEKPTNMSFCIRGNTNEYATLQELENDLVGIIEKKSQKTIIIDWKWNYESGENESAIISNDKVDTREGEKLKSYKFKIVVTGEENI